ncbi:MAG TPA: hypothetical protein VHV30_17025 [Polyangiaceae bacterium]|jgi:hypothetical protein|nr:hypothetical protein [Polyangiaceae bacterium]
MSSSRRTLPRAWIARAWCAFVAISVLFGVAQAGARYFYCESLGLSATDPCAASAPSETRQPPCPLASFGRAPFDCCQVITMRSMPEGARAIEPSVPSAGVVAVLPPVVGPIEPASGRGPSVARAGERWRGPPRASRERRAQLMVFLT